MPSVFAGASPKKKSSGQAGLIKPREKPDERPASFFDRYHKRTRTQEVDCGVYGTIHFSMFALGVPFYRLEVVGIENVPEHGPILLAPNHHSFADHFLVACMLNRIVNFMAKSQMFKKPWDEIYTHGGTFPVRRGQRDEESIITALTILGANPDIPGPADGTVAMYCEGGRLRPGEEDDPAKRGIGRLAAVSGVPVVPIAVVGSNALRYWKRPWKMRWPKITVVFGQPLSYPREATPSRERQQYIADEILQTFRKLARDTMREPGWGRWVRNWIGHGRRMAAYKVRSRLGIA